MDPRTVFQAIPWRIRLRVYQAYAVAVVGVALAGIYGVDVSTHAQALTYLGGLIAVSSASNVHPPVGEGPDADSEYNQ